MNASLGLYCRTGGCLYDTHPSTPPSPSPSSQAASAFPGWRTAAGRALIGVEILLAILALLLTRWMQRDMLTAREERRRDFERAMTSDEEQGRAETVQKAMDNEEEEDDDLLVAQVCDHDRWNQSLPAMFLPLPSMPHEHILSWHDVHLAVMDAAGHRIPVLKRISGVARRGLTAILGPSGSGKTSLLDILAGRRGALAHLPTTSSSSSSSSPALTPGSPIFASGMVRLNGQPIHHALLQRIVGYVQQDDVLPASSTVYEHLAFHAQLVLCALSKEAREERIWRVLEQLGLRKVAHTRIGDAYTRGLSGGERRRLSLGVELLSSPSILLCDEPTTGLDSTHAAKVIELLRDLASSGVTVILSIHQPRVDMLRHMDRVLLLASTGQLAYTGSMDAAEAHFAALGHVRPSSNKTSETSEEEALVNLADFMLNVVLKSPTNEVTRLCDAFGRSDFVARDQNWIDQLALQQPPPPPPIVRPRPSLSTQLGPLVTRQLRHLYRHPWSAMLHFGASLATALLLGLLFRGAGGDYTTLGMENRFGVLYILTFHIVLTGMYALPMWNAHQLLFRREQKAGLVRAPMHLLASLLGNVLPLRIPSCLVFSLVTYWMVGLRCDGAAPILWFTVISCLASVTAAVQSMAVGAAFRSLVLGNIVVALGTLISMLGGGLMRNRPKVPRLWARIMSISYVSVAYEALVVNEFHKAPHTFLLTAPVESLSSLDVTGDAVLAMYGFDATGLVRQTMWLVALLAATCLGATMSLTLLDEEWLQAWRRGWSRVVGEEKEVVAPPEFSSLYPLRSIQGAGLIVMPREREAMKSLVLSWHNLSFAIKHADGRRRTILHGASGVALGGSGEELDPTASSGGGGCMFAVLGASGSGKTTLLDLLSGRKEPLRHGRKRASQSQQEEPSRPFQRRIASQSELTQALLADVSSDADQHGAVLLNGCPATARTLRHTVGYVQQEDVLPSTSTVLEYLAFQASLRLPPAEGGGRNDGGEDLIVPPPPSSMLGRDGDSVHGGVMRSLPSNSVHGIFPPSPPITIATMTTTSTVASGSAAGPHAYNSELRVNDYRLQRVWQVIELLGLTRVANRLIGDEHDRGLSRGERRRVSLGVELLSSPSILLCDEPTTGLDTTHAAKVIELLRDLASSGVTVILSIHQPRPDVFAKMDRVLVLSPLGEMVYSGPTMHLAHHFASLGRPLIASNNNSNRDAKSLADHVLDHVLKHPSSEVREWSLAYSSSRVALLDASYYNAATQRMARLSVVGAAPSRPDSPADEEETRTASIMTFWSRLVPTVSLVAAADTTTPPIVVAMLLAAEKRRAPFSTQLFALRRRLHVALERASGPLAIHTLAAVLISLALGTLYWRLGIDSVGIQDRVAALFFMVLYTVVFSLAALPLWHQGLLLFRRERTSGIYGTVSYFMSTVLDADLLPLRIAPPLIFVLFAYWMMELNGSLASMLRLVLILLLCNTTAASLLLLLGAACSSPSLANLMGSFLLSLLLLLGGLVHSRAGGTLPWLLQIVSRFSFVSYSLDALLVNEFHGVDGFRFSAPVPHGIDPAHVPFVQVSGDQVLDSLGVVRATWGGVALNCLALLAMTMLQLGGVLGILMFRTRHHD